jgi:hypothetical protein
MHGLLLVLQKFFDGAMTSFASCLLKTTQKPLPSSRDEMREIKCPRRSGDKNSLRWIDNSNEGMRRTIKPESVL